MLLVDTNIWLAAVDLSSPRHESCASLLAAHAGELTSTVPVVAETGWLLLDRSGASAQQRCLAAVASEQVMLVDLTLADLTRVHELVGLRGRRARPRG